jgi:mercuric ion transport protein
MTPDQNKAQRQLRIGILGSLVAALCCVTPMLAFLLILIGLAAFVPYLDYVLFPLMGLFLAIGFYGWLKQRDKKDTRETL